MKRKLGAALLATALAAAVAVPAATAAGPAGRGGGYGSPSRTGNMYHEPARTPQRLRDGTCIDPARPGAGAMEKRGFTYGPGDGTGNFGDRPMDGTGYGSPSNR